MGKGHPLSEETKKKLSIAHIGKPGPKFTEEQRKKSAIKEKALNFLQSIVSIFRKAKLAFTLAGKIQKLVKFFVSKPEKYLIALLMLEIGQNVAAIIFRPFALAI